MKFKSWIDFQIFGWIHFPLEKINKFLRQSHIQPNSIFRRNFFEWIFFFIFIFSKVMIFQEFELFWEFFFVRFYFSHKIFSILFEKILTEKLSEIFFPSRNIHLSSSSIFQFFDFHWNWHWHILPSILKKPHSTIPSDEKNFIPDFQIFRFTYLHTVFLLLSWKEYRERGLTFYQNISISDIHWWFSSLTNK